MGWKNPDAYNQPEYFGLEEVGQIELSEPDYSFDFGVVWFHQETRRFYYAEDSGCSCPSPFEWYTSLESLGEPMKLKQLTKRLREVRAGDSYVTPVPDQVRPILDRAEALWNAA